MHYNPSTPVDAEVMRDIAADRVAEAVASIERWQRIRDTRQAEYAQAVEALSWWTFPMYGGTSDASTTPR
ncbi:hypothetical protein EBR44_13820 [bacterium]|nr:hypothetical protein [bacterium]